MEDGNEKIKVKSKNGSEFEVNRVACELSIFLKNNLPNYTEKEPIPLEDIDDEALNLCVQYLNHYNGTAPSRIESPVNNISEISDQFAIDFIDNLSMEVLIGLNVAANLMEIAPLLDLSSAKIALLCKDLSDSEILNLFGIEPSFSSEEKDKILSQNKWLSDEGDI